MVIESVGRGYECSLSRKSHSPHDKVAHTQKDVHDEVLIEI